MPIVPGTHVVYTVRPGDSLYLIADQFGTSVPALVEANAYRPPIAMPELLYPGLKLLVPLPGMSQQSAVLHQVTEGDTLYRLAARYSVGLDMLAALNQLERPEILRVAQLIYVPAFAYEIEQGDTLTGIARRFGVTVTDLIQANEERPGFSLDLLYPGFRLVVPLPSSANIAVYQPLPGARIAAGQELTGVARAFEATVLYQIRDAVNRAVTEERHFMTEEGAPAFSPFRVQLQFDAAPTTSSGTLMVYTRSAKDGSIQDLVSIPVAFG